MKQQLHNVLWLLLVSVLLTVYIFLLARPVPGPEIGRRWSASPDMVQQSEMPRMATDSALQSLRPNLTMRVR